MLEETAAMMETIRSNASVHAIFKKTLAGTYRSYRAGLIDEEEYQAEHKELLYRCVLMAS